VNSRERKLGRILNTGGVIVTMIGENRRVMSMSRELRLGKDIRQMSRVMEAGKRKG